MLCIYCRSSLDSLAFANGLKWCLICSGSLSKVRVPKSTEYRLIRDPIVVRVSFFPRKSFGCLYCSLLFEDRRQDTERI